VTFRDYDVAITLQRLKSRRFVIHHLTDYRLELYATPRYLEKRPPIRRREDLAAHALIWYVESLLDVPELEIFEERVSAARPILRSSNIFAQLASVLADGGVGLLPRFLVAEHPELVHTLPDEVSVRRTMWLVTRQEGLNLARVRSTLHHLVTYVAELQHWLVGPLPATS
jgi:DNA-binding transcriptional LysR family regulator